MCIVDHTSITPGYLIYARVESFTPPEVFTRILHNYEEVGLTSEQICRLLDVAAAHNKEYMRVSIEFANVTAELDLVEVDTDIQRKEYLLDRHAKLFREHEALLLRAYEQAHKILSREQMYKVAEIYEREKQMFLEGLKLSLKRALAPKLTPVVQEAEL